MKNIITLIFLFIISGSAFADNYTYLKGSQLIQSNQAIVSNGGTTQLDATSPMKTAVTGSNTHIVKLPNASLLLVGTSFQILNKSTQTITVKDFSDVTLDTLAPNTDKTYILFSGGLWQSSSGGSGGKIIAGTSPIVVNQDATTATISLDTTKTRQFGGAVTTPTFTDNGGGSITVNSVDVNLWADSTFTGDASTYTVGPITQTLTDNTTSYVVADYNGGSPILRITTDVNEITESNIIPVFTIYRSGATLHTLDWDTLGRGLANKTHQSIVKTQRYRRESGLAISESGTRNVNLSSGIIYVGANRQSLSSIASLTDNIIYFERTGASSWNTTSIQSYNNTQYWNGTTNATLTNGRYAVNWLFRGVESQKHLYMVIGEGDYNLAQAQASQPPANLPGNITSHGLLVGRIIVAKSANVATQIDSAFNIVFTQQAASNHNDLGAIQGGAASEYYHLTQAKYNAVQNLTASGTQTNFTGDVQSASCVYYGASTVDGSYRDCASGGVLIRSKRVSGSWSEVYRVE